MTRMRAWSRRQLLATGIVAGLVVVAGAFRAEAPVDCEAHQLHRQPPARIVAPGLSQHTLELALRAYAEARARGEIERQILSVIDYTLPSTEKRLWVLDLEHRRVLFHELVAHGRKSGENLALAFSNAAGSHQSSIGVFRTGERYVGENGVSLRLEGLEPGINDRATERAIVMHGAPYVSDQFAARHGRIGRSFGCPAVRPAIADSLIDTIRNGTLLFASYPDSAYTAGSAYVRP